MDHITSCTAILGSPTGYEKLLFLILSFVFRTAAMDTDPDPQLLQSAKNDDWSIAYINDTAYAYLTAKTNLLGNTQLTARCFLIAAQVGNGKVVMDLEKILRKQQRDGLRVVYLIALRFIRTINPELAYELLTEQVLAKATWEIS